MGFLLFITIALVTTRLVESKKKKKKKRRIYIRRIEPSMSLLLVSVETHPPTYTDVSEKGHEERQGDEIHVYNLLSLLLKYHKNSTTFIQGPNKRQKGSKVGV